MKVAAASTLLAPAAGGAWLRACAEDPVAASTGDDQDAASSSEAAAAPSFDEIYERYLVFVWRALHALGVSQPLLDDAVQDVFVVVHRRLATFEGRSKLTTWLFGIALRVARNYRRGRRPSEDLSAIAEQVGDVRQSPFEATARSEAIQVIERILDALDEKKRLVFVLMDIEQMTAEEVAEILGVNVNTVYSRRRTARLEFDRLVALHGKWMK